MTLQLLPLYEFFENPSLAQYVLKEDTGLRNPTVLWIMRALSAYTRRTKHH